MQASQLLAAARRVRLEGRRRSRDALAGGYRSAFRGAGLEFEESREYTPGDDVAAIDWKVTARMGRPFIKQFREERERTLLLVVDMSRSMTAPGAGGTPFETAALAAVTLAVSAAASRDRVGVLLFSDRVEAFLPPLAGQGRPYAVAAALAETVPAGAATDPGPAFALLRAALSRSSVVFVFSDFLAPAFPPLLGRLSVRHEVTAVWPGIAWEPDLPAYGFLQLTDLETGQHAVLDCGSARARTRYRTACRREREARVAALARAGVGILELPADTSPAPALERYFRHRARPGVA